MTKLDPSNNAEIFESRVDKMSINSFNHTYESKIKHTSGHSASY